MSKNLSYRSLLEERKTHLVQRETQREPLSASLPDRKVRKRVGRGIASGTGKTAGKGHKGQKARAGYSSRAGFEGGQTPLYRRLPKRGFRNFFKKDYQIVNLYRLEKSKLKGELSPTLLKEGGLISKEKLLIKVLGPGEISGITKIEADAFSKNALEKLKAIGCECVVRNLKNSSPKKAAAPQKK